MRKSTKAYLNQLKSNTSLHSYLEQRVRDFSNDNNMTMNAENMLMVGNDVEIISNVGGCNTNQRVGEESQNYI